MFSFIAGTTSRVAGQATGGWPEALTGHRAAARGARCSLQDALEGAHDLWVELGAGTVA